MNHDPTDSLPISAFQFVSDDNEHGRGVAINWKSYKKSEKIASLKADNFTEQVIDFEEGWPWYFITRDPDYPDAFEWKLNRGYTNSVGTGPKADRQVQTLVLQWVLQIRQRKIFKKLGQIRQNLK